MTSNNGFNNGQPWLEPLESQDEEPCEACTEHMATVEVFSKDGVSRGIFCPRDGLRAVRRERSGTEQEC